MQSVISRCRMLVDRGPIYSKQTTSTHPCSCTLSHIDVTDYALSSLEASCSTGNIHSPILATSVSCSNSYIKYKVHVLDEFRQFFMFDAGRVH